MSNQSIDNKLITWGKRLVRRLGGRVLALLFASMMLALISVMFTDAWLLELKQQNEQLAQVQHNIAGLQHLRSSLNQAESAQRGYLLNQREELSTMFNQAIDSSRRNIRKIEGLLTAKTVKMDDKQEQNWMIVLSSALEAKNAEMKLAMSLLQAGKTDEALQVVKLEQGIMEMAKFMQYSQMLIDHQYEALATLSKKREQTIVVARISVIGTALILLLLVILVIRQLVQEMNSRDHLRRQLARDCEAYEERIRNNAYLMETLALEYQADVERARQKLAHDLHDELGSILTATKLDISWTIRRVRATHPEVVEKLNKTTQYLNQGIQFKRQVVQNLHPSIITTIGFLPALRSLIEDAAERNDWELDLILPDEHIQLPETIGLIAYRVIQESMNNASKYAYATKVGVHLIVAEDYLELKVEDNGVGVDLSNTNAAAHGLSGIRNRISAIGGRVDITSAPNEGFHLRAIIPTKLS